MSHQVIDIGISENDRLENCRRSFPFSRRQLHALSENTLLPLERHRPNVQYIAPDVRNTIYRTVTGS